MTSSEALGAIGFRAGQKTTKGCPSISRCLTRATICGLFSPRELGSQLLNNTTGTFGFSACTFSTVL